MSFFPKKVTQYPKTPSFQGRFKRQFNFFLEKKMFLMSHEAKKTKEPSTLAKRLLLAKN